MVVASGAILCNRKSKLERHRARSFSALCASPLIKNNLQLHNALETALCCKLALHRGMRSRKDTKSRCRDATAAAAAAGCFEGKEEK